MNDFLFLMWKIGLKKSLITQVFILLANTHAQAESLRHSLILAAGGISLHVNPEKAEFMRYKQTSPY